MSENPEKVKLEVWGAKVPVELKQKVADFVSDNFNNSADFLVAALNSLRVESAQDDQEVVKELSSLRHIQKQIEDIFVSIITLSKRQSEVSESRISALQSDLREAEAMAFEAREELKKVSKDALDQVEAIRAEAALARETVANEVQEMKEALVRAREAQEQSARLANLAEEAATATKARVEELEEKAALADQYKKELEDAKQVNSDLVRQVDKIKEEMDRKLERAESEREKALLSLRNELTEKLRAEYEDRSMTAIAAAEAKAEDRVMKAEKEAAQAHEKASLEIAKIREALDKERDARVKTEKLADKVSETAVDANTRAAVLQEKANLADLYLQERNDLETRLQQELVDREKSLLAKEREHMKEVSKLREDLAQIREEKAALEISLVRAGNKQQTKPKKDS